MVEELTESVKQVINSAAQKLTGSWRRRFQAEMTSSIVRGIPVEPSRFSVGDGMRSTPG